MTKRQLIDEIVAIHRTAPASFLARFEDRELNDYLEHLRLAREPRPTSDQTHYYKYFQPVHAAADLPEQGQFVVGSELTAMPLFDQPLEDNLASPPPAEDVQEDHEEPAPVAASAERTVSSVSEDQAEAWLY